MKIDNRRLGLRVGEWVEVKSKEEILVTLDKKAQLDGLPFMPQMFEFCGKRFRVYKRAHKTCDYVVAVRGRRMASAVHLETRCDGAAYGGCQAGCLIFWKEAWLRRVSERRDSTASIAEINVSKEPYAVCSEDDVWAATKATGSDQSAAAQYVCQVTQLPEAATSDLEWWDLRQYIEDYTSGNVTMWRLLCGFVYSVYYHISIAGIGIGSLMRWLYDVAHPLWRGYPFPRRNGHITVGQPTPTANLGLQPGELVRVKSHKEILATLDTSSKNRGLYYDAEMVPFSGGVFRVLRRVDTIVDERTGKLLKMKTSCVILDDVFCQSRYSYCRMFCPRGIYSYWREVWLERATADSRQSSLPDGSTDRQPYKPLAS